jgi:plastocyanin
MLTKSKLYLLLVLALSGAGLSLTRAHASAPVLANEVVIENFSYQPTTLTVAAGTTVTCVNHDDEPHTVTETNKRFNSKALDNGDRFSKDFTQPGTYNYYCALHPKMTGQVIVK